MKSFENMVKLGKAKVIRYIILLILFGVFIYAITIAHYRIIKKVWRVKFILIYIV